MKTFTINEGNIRSHQHVSKLQALQNQQEWFLKFTAVPDWTMLPQNWTTLLHKYDTPTNLHVDMRTMTNCQHWKTPLTALLHAIPRRFGNSPNLFVYVPLEGNIFVCLQMLVFAVLGTGYISVVASRIKICLIAEQLGPSKSVFACSTPGCDRCERPKSCARTIAALRVFCFFENYPDGNENCLVP